MANVRGTKVVGDGNKPVIEKFVPAAGWTGDSNSHYLLIDLPEFKKEQVKIQIAPSTGNVMVSGERATNQNKHVRFEQTYKVPGENSDLNKITATFDGEILYITVPKQVVEKERDETTSTATIEKKNVNGGDVAEEKTQEKPHDDEQLKKTDEQVKKTDEEVEKTDEQLKKTDEQVKKTDEEVEKTDEQVKKTDEEVEKTDEESHGDNGHGGQSKKKEKLDGNCCTRFPPDSIVKELEHEEGPLRIAMKTLSQNGVIIATALIAFSLGVLLSRRSQH